MRLLTCDPDAEIMAANARSFIEHIYGERTRPILEKYGLYTGGAPGWMPTRNLLGAFNELAQRPNVTFNMVAMGVEVGTRFGMPPELANATLAEVLMGWGAIYQTLNRNGDPGAIETKAIDAQHYITIHTDLFPDDFNYGIVYGYARRFLPADMEFSVYFDPEVLPRDQGGTGPTIIHVEWESEV